MALIYKPIQSTIETKSGEKNWHPTLVKVGRPVTTHDLSEKIAVMSSLTPGDVHNAFRCLPIVLREELLNGRSVKIEGLGTFTLKIRSRGKGVTTADKVNPSQITNLHCQFTPEYSRVGESTTRALTQGAEFVHINQLKTGLLGTEDGNDANNGGGGDDGVIDPEA